MIDDEEWAVRYVVVDTVEWWPGGHVPVSPEWVEQVGWDASTLYVTVTRDAVRTAP